jgi:hypothetical protein
VPGEVHPEVVPGLLLQHVVAHQPIVPVDAGICK